MKSKQLKMIEKFQCPGCVCGSDTKCGKLMLEDTEVAGAYCLNHVLGTSMLGAGCMALGLPKGFNKAGFEYGQERRHRNQMLIRLWSKGRAPEYNQLNVPVWAMEHEGYLFVRVWSPRVDRSSVDVIEGGARAEICPQALNVAEFIEEID